MEASESDSLRATAVSLVGVLVLFAFTFGNLTRPGLALYGGIPVRGDVAQEEGIRAVVAVEAQVIQVRDVAAGQSVGYGATYVAGCDTKVAILNIGYADGYLRLLGEENYAWAGDRVCPILGRISMDLLAVEVPQAGMLRRINLSATGPDKISDVPLEGVDVREGDWLRMNFDLPALAGPLSQYELLTGLGARFDRVWR